MATTYNIVERRYNGTDYDTLYPATKGENLVSPVPVELGGTGGITGAAGMKNLLDALSTVTPTGTDLLPLKDVSGNIAGKATIDSILSLVSGGAKIQTGSYVGTGTYGQANPCSLTFDFEPKVWSIYCYGKSYSVMSMAINIVPYGVDGYLDAYVQSSPTMVARNKVSYSGNTVSWYTTESTAPSAQGQLNNSSDTYYYFAIG